MFGNTVPFGGWNDTGHGIWWHHFPGTEFKDSSTTRLPASARHEWESQCLCPRHVSLLLPQFLYAQCFVLFIQKFWSYSFNLDHCWSHSGSFSVGVVSTVVPDSAHKLFIGGLPNYLNDDQVCVKLALCSVHWQGPFIEGLQSYPSIGESFIIRSPHLFTFYALQNKIQNLFMFHRTVVSWNFTFEQSIANT